MRKRIKKHIDQQVTTWKKEKKGMKIFEEFKKFITRGNVLDLGVGVIIGGAFTAIVNALSNNILKPVVNWILSLLLKKESLTELYTPLKGVWIVGEDGVGTLDLVNSIYIDWGLFIQAVLSFFLTAIVLFIIVKVINTVREQDEKLKKQLKPKITKEERKAMRAKGIKLKDKAAVAAYLEAKAAAEAEKAAAEKAAAEEKARLDREANPTTEDLLKKILAVLQEKKD